LTYSDEDALNTRLQKKNGTVASSFARNDRRFGENWLDNPLLSL